MGSVVSGIGSVVDNTLGTNIFGANSTDKAMGAQTKGTNQANSVLKSSLEAQQGYLNPQYNIGMNAMNQLASGNLVDPSTLGQDQGYKFRQQQGETAINNAAAARGMGNSGATMKALANYNSDLASQEYDKAYNRQYQTLSQLAGYGNNAANNLSSAVGSYGSNVSNNYTGLGSANAAAHIAQGNQQAGLVGTAVGALFSDERLKEDLVEIDPVELAEMRAQLKAFRFKYKSKDHGAGDWIGVMAQDLERSKLGRTLVFEDENGRKQIHMPRLLSLFLATMAEAA